LNGY